MLFIWLLRFLKAMPVGVFQAFSFSIHEYDGVQKY